MINMRWARVDEREEVQDFLFSKMGKIPHERWRNILDCRWNKQDQKYGVVVEKNGELAGFLGIVFADRKFAGADHRTGNITSWFLEKNLRRSGLGQEMLELITSPVGVTYTATSANFRSGALLKKIGWELLDDTRLFWKRDQSFKSNKGKLVSGASQLLGSLGKQEQKIVSDHEGLNFTPHLLIDEDQNRLFFLTYMKIKGEKETRHHEILYASDAAVLAKNIRFIARALLDEENSILSSDKRLLAKGVGFDVAENLKVARYYKPVENLPPQSIDFLYGEVMLLDLKVY